MYQLDTIKVGRWEAGDQEWKAEIERGFQGSRLVPGHYWWLLVIIIVIIGHYWSQVIIVTITTFQAFSPILIIIIIIAITMQYIGGYTQSTCQTIQAVWSTWTSECTAAFTWEPSFLHRWTFSGLGSFYCSKMVVDVVLVKIPGNDDVYNYDTDGHIVSRGAALANGAWQGSTD